MVAGSSPAVEDLVGSNPVVEGPVAVDPVGSSLVDEEGPAEGGPADSSSGSLLMAIGYLCKRLRGSAKSCLFIFDTFDREKCLAR